ncbi:hypothetical protein DRP05_00865 [Archaeoglobales archaeon]|nr:MAG: hypothetical protein DRP05_00865 [Archaeoglobales archaeon]
MLDKEIELLKAFKEEAKPIEVYSSKDWGFSRATFYRRLEKLKEQGLIEWKGGKARITRRGEQILRLFDPTWVPEVKIEEEKEIGGRFCITETMKLKQLAYQSGFVYITYPAASYILKTICLYAGIQTRGLTTNAEKFKAIVQSDCKISLAIDNFENASKQALVFLRELILAGKIERLYVGVKDERKALRNSKLLEFLQDFEFENQKGLKLEADSVTLFPVLLIILIGFGIIIAYRLGVAYAPVYAFFILIYFLRSSLFREIRK